MPRRPVISKSAFIRGKQCLKSLYLIKKHPERRDAVSEGQQAIFDRGHSVGELAQQLFPGGVMAAFDLPEGFMKSMYRTRNLIEGGHEIIYEAGFMVSGTHCFADILVRDGSGWKVYEVKSSTKISEVYLYDAAFQYRVIRNSGLKITDFSIVFINNQYVRQGELDIHSLFTVQSVHDEVLSRQHEISELLEQQVNALQQEAVPDISIGPHCFDPYDCDFMGHCWHGVPEYSVFDIARLDRDKKFDLFHSGIELTADLPDQYPLSANQQMQVDADKTGKAIIDRDAIKAFLETLSYPLYFLDFETFNPAIPLHDNSRPYQQIVFQYSLHILESKAGEMIHREYLASTSADPRKPMMEQLISNLDGSGSILVYNQGFEVGRLNEIARDFPEYEKPVLDIQARIIDLMAPFQQKAYYTPAMKGSYSIKEVLPALVPGFSYKNLAISKGGDASLAFESLLQATDPEMIAKTRKDLLDYCAMDTLAMVELLRVLEEEAGW